MIRYDEEEQEKLIQSWAEQWLKKKEEWIFSK